MSVNKIKNKLLGGVSVHINEKLYVHSTEGCYQTHTKNSTIYLPIQKGEFFCHHRKYEKFEHT